MTTQELIDRLQEIEDKRRERSLFLCSLLTGKSPNDHIVSLEESVREADREAATQARYEAYLFATNE